MDKITENYNSPMPPMRELIKKDKYNGVEYVIVWFLGHPNAYINVPKEYKLYQKDYNSLSTDIELSYDPHGEFTFSGKNLHKEYGLEDGWYLGWDYAHSSDYVNTRGMRDITYDGRRYSTEEIEDECKNVIDAINEFEKLNSKKEKEN